MNIFPKTHRWPTGTRCMLTREMQIKPQDLTSHLSELAVIKKTTNKVLMRRWRKGNLMHC